MTMLQELGGREAVEMVVAAFYDRVLADPMLKGYFRGVQMSRLMKNQADFFCEVLGAPGTYRGRDMVTVHRGMNISDEEFNAVAVHLSDALAECGVGKAHIDQVIGLVATLRPQVVTRAPESSLKKEFYKPVCPVAAVKAFPWGRLALAFMLLLVVAAAGVVVWKG